MAITGAHVLLYSPEAAALRKVLSEVFGWESVDAGEGWLIFALPPAELGVHPAEQASYELTLMCDDIDATVADLRAKGIRFRDEPHEEEDEGKFQHCGTSTGPRLRKSCPSLETDANVARDWH